MKRGLRIEWLVLFGALLALSFTPLYFAVARLTEATMVGVREKNARELGRAIAGHIGAAGSARETERLTALLDAQVDGRGVVAVAAYGRDHARVAASGVETEDLPLTLDEAGEVARRLGQPPRARLLVIMPAAASDDLGAAVLLSIDASTGPLGPLVKLIALYTVVVGFALLVFGYFLMTRLVVRPLEDLSRAASRVAGGSRTLELRPTNTRELADLGESLATMTAHLQAEEASLRGKVAELERATRELKSAQATVVRSERLASVGRLAAGLAHEIGNPIAAILGFEELLIDGGMSDEESRDFLLRMKAETERVNKVLRDLLAFARAPSQRADAIAEPGSVVEALDGVVTLIGPQRSLKGIAIERDIAAALPLVSMSPEHLTQVFLNLLLNAADAAPNADGRIVVSASSAAEGGVVLHIDDNGAGIAEAVKASLFEPFVTTKDVGKGTGLGLSVCKGLVESAGGTISVGTSPMGGARFTVELPAFAESTRRPKAGAASAR